MTQPLQTVEENIQPEGEVVDATVAAGDDLFSQAMRVRVRLGLSGFDPWRYPLT